jgi:hypothetical protein
LLYFSLCYVQKITNDAFEKIGADRWLSACKRADVVVQLKITDHFMDDIIDSIIINFAETAAQILKADYMK